MSVARANANIALVKYWGKRDLEKNIPAAGSLSLTLDALQTWTEVELVDSDRDQLVLSGVEQGGRPLLRVCRFLDLVRMQAGRNERARVRSHNTFPTAAGLASSASAFAALAVAAADAYGLKLSKRELSILARLGSGSAARSVFGRFVRMHAGSSADGVDAFAEPLEVSMELAAVLVVAKAGTKEIGSTDGMEQTRRSSPYYASWLEQVDRDLVDVERALASQDVEQLATLVEGNCLAMHACALAARPSIVYFNAATFWAMGEVRRLRASGLPVFFTVDAGPHLVAFVSPDSAPEVAERLSQHADLGSVTISHAGSGAHIVEALPTNLEPLSTDP